MKLKRSESGNRKSGKISRAIGVIKPGVGGKKEHIIEYAEGRGR